MVRLMCPPASGGRPCLETTKPPGEAARDGQRCEDLTGSRLARRPPPARPEDSARRLVHGGMVARSAGGVNARALTPSTFAPYSRSLTACTREENAMRIVDLSMTVEECDSAPFAKD